VTKKILSEEDRDLFRETVGNVRSVKNDKAYTYGQNKPKPFPRRPMAGPEENLALTLGEGAYGLSPVGAEDEISYVAQGIPKDSLVKLRQGYFVPEAEMDLHGLGSNDAKRELVKFLRDCVRSGYRCVHIVHGKGYRSEDQYPMLKNNINLWLRQHRDVQAFTSAAPKDGGAGAVYILLCLP